MSRKVNMPKPKAALPWAAALLVLAAVPAASYTGPASWHHHHPGPSPSPSPTSASPSPTSADPTPSPTPTDTSSSPAPTLTPTPGSTDPAPGFYVATDGSDASPGTSAAPFATFTACQKAMENSTVKTCYIKAGTYHPASAGGDCSAASTAIDLVPADAGETWSYDPASGYDTAVIDGGSTAADTGLAVGICVRQASNVTIDGLEVQDFASSLVRVLFAPDTTITDNVLHGTYEQPFTAAVMARGTSQGLRVLHNVIYHVASNGISAHSCNGGYGGCAQGISGDVIEYNYVRDFCYDDYDCGGVEFQDYDTPRSTGILAAYNYVQDADLTGPGAPVNDGGGIGGGRVLYLDDGTSNVTYQGNIVTGRYQYCAQIHGGSGNTFRNNICDLQPPAAGQNVGNTGAAILYFQDSSQGNGMTGDSDVSNIITGSDPGGGRGYAGDGTAPTVPLIADSAYRNYAGGPSGPCYPGGVNACGSAGADTSPQPVSDLFAACPADGADSWSFELDPGSPARSAPVSFPEPGNDLGIAWGHPGFWGPPGWTIPHAGSVPSYGPC